MALDVFIAKKIPGFAQRVAQITNNARVNEELSRRKFGMDVDGQELDPKLLIARLKREVSELKAEAP